MSIKSINCVAMYHEIMSYLWQDVESMGHVSGISVILYAGLLHRPYLITCICGLGTRLNYILGNVRPAECVANPRLGLTL